MCARARRQSKCIALTGTDDADGYAKTTEAMKALGVSADEQAQLLSLLSALLLLGNVSFEQDDNDKAFISAREALAAAEERLGCGLLTQNLTSKKMSRGGKGGQRNSVYTIEYSKSQAEMVRDAVIKAIYTSAFDWVVTKVNAFICGTDYEKTSRRAETALATATDRSFS
eukprot:6187383-Pleurochrysis_carterae.AAC.2